MSQAMIAPFESWTQSPLACFDVESTGPDLTADRIVTAYVATINGSEVAGNHWLLDPSIEISEGATAVHGISTEKARTEGGDYEEGLLGIWTALQLEWGDGFVVATYNGVFDLTMLTYELRRLGHKPGEVGPIFDGLCIDKHYDKFRKGSRKLADVVKHYGVSIGDAHNADADALAAARLAWKMPRVYPELAKLTIPALMELQKRAYREQRESFREYKSRKGETINDFNTDWPVRRAA